MTPSYFPFLRAARLIPLLAIVTPVAVHAEGTTSAELGSGLFQVFFGLGLVLILMVGSLWIIKRLTAPRGIAASLLRIIAGISVGPRERVVVVEIGDNWLVLGVAPGQITALHQMPRQEAPLNTDNIASAPPGKDFGAWLKQIMDRRNAS